MKNKIKKISSTESKSLKKTLNSNLDYRQYYDKYHFMTSIKEDSDLNFLGLNSLKEYPKVEKVTIRINSWESYDSRKNLQLSSSITPELLLTMKSLLKVLGGKPDFFLKKDVYDKKINEFQMKSGFENFFILHDKEDIYSLFDKLFFESDIVQRYIVDQIDLSLLNSKNQQTITFKFGLDEFSEAKFFEDFLNIDFNVKLITVTIEFLVQGKIQFIK